MFAEIAPRLAACARKSTDPMARIGSRLLNAAPPVACCSRLMQPKPPLSSSTMVSLQAQHDRGGDLRIHHQVAAVAHHDDHLARRVAPASRRGRRRSRSPCRNSRIPDGSCPARRARHSLCSSPGRPPAAQTTMASRRPPRAAPRRSPARPMGARRCSARWRRRPASRQSARHAAAHRSMLRWRTMLCQRGVQRRQALRAHRRPAAALRACAHRTAARSARQSARRREQRPRAGGEILQAGCQPPAPHRPLRPRGSPRRAGHPDRTEVQRMIAPAAHLCRPGFRPLECRAARRTDPAPRSHPNTARRRRRRSAASVPRAGVSRLGEFGRDQAAIGARLQTRGAKNAAG